MQEPQGKHRTLDAGCAQMMEKQRAVAEIQSLNMTSANSADEKISDIRGGSDKSLPPKEEMQEGRPQASPATSVRIPEGGWEGAA